MTLPELCKPADIEFLREHFSKSVKGKVGSSNCKSLVEVPAKTWI